MVSEQGGPLEKRQHRPMADWYLTFKGARSIAIEACKRLLAAVVDGSVTLAVGELSGNPRDFYSRAVSVTGTRGAVHVALRASQGLRDAGDPEAILTDVSITLSSETAAYPEKLATWRALETAFAAFGWSDQTLTLGAAPIVDDAEAAGDQATATSLRNRITTALIANASRTRHVSIASPRVDVEPILAAYQEPEQIVSFSMSDCGLRTLPTGFARFPNLECLSFEDDTFDGSVLRGVSLPKLQRLSLCGKALRRVSKQDLAGFPALEILTLAGSPLESLDPDIVDACPQLTRVYVEGTPLSGNARAMAELRAHWPRMLWRYEDGVTDRDAQQPTPTTTTTPLPKRLREPSKAKPRSAKSVAPPVPFRDGVLDLTGPDYTIQHIRRLVASGDYHHTITLKIHHTTIGDAFVKWLATASAFPALVELNLSDSDVSDIGVHVLATKAIGLDALACIRLGEVASDGHVGVSDTAVQALAESSRLPALRQITRSITHHVYSSHASDAIDTTTIVRNDGRTIESIIDHLIWP